MNQQKAPQVSQPQVPQQHPSNFPVYQNMQPHHPYNPHIAQHNMVYQGQYQHQQQPQHLQMGQARPLSMPPFQGQQMGGYQSQGQVQVMQPGQFWWLICKKLFKNGRGYKMWYIGETAVYVVLAILIVAFLFFVINTIRCYMSKPKYVDDDDDFVEH